MTSNPTTPTGDRLQTERPPVLDDGADRNDGPERNDDPHEYCLGVHWRADEYVDCQGDPI